MIWRDISCVVVVILLAACESPDAPIAPRTAAATSQPTPSPPTQSRPPDFPPCWQTARSVFHRADLGDAWSIAIDLEAGTFVQSLRGCDVVGDWRGTAHLEGEDVILEGSPSLWLGGGALTHARVSCAPADGEVELTVVQVDGASVAERWSSGAACPVCRGRIGPRGPPSACEWPTGERAPAPAPRTPPSDDELACPPGGAGTLVLSCTHRRARIRIDESGEQVALPITIVVTSGLHAIEYEVAGERHVVRMCLHDHERYEGRCPR